FFEIGAGARGIERGPAAADAVEEGVFVGDVEEGVVLAGHGGFRHVFGGGAGSYGDGRRAHGAVGAGDLVDEVGGDFLGLGAGPIAVSVGGDAEAVGDGEG